MDSTILEPLSKSCPGLMASHTTASSFMLTRPRIGLCSKELKVICVMVVKHMLVVSMLSWLLKLYRWVFGAEFWTLLPQDLVSTLQQVHLRVVEGRVGFLVGITVMVADKARPAKHNKINISGDT